MILEYLKVISLPFLQSRKHYSHFQYILRRLSDNHRAAGSLGECVVAQWFNTLTLLPGQSGGWVRDAVGPRHLSVMTRGRGFD